jgi:hypothetical protein
VSATTINRALLRTIPALSVVAPLVIFGFIYVLAISPARQAAAAARVEAEAARAALARTRAELRNAPSRKGPLPTPHTFEVRTASELADAVKAIAGSQSAGGVEQLSVQMNGALVVASFDARYSQLDEFFSSLDAIGGAYDVRSVDIVQNRDKPSVRATVLLQVRGEPAVDVPLVADASAAFSPVPAEKASAPPFRPGRKRTPVPVSVAPLRSVPEGPDPIVRTILFSSQQKSALVDGRIVRPGDRVGAGTVQSIEADAVVLVSDGGHVKRLALESLRTQATKR